MDEGAFGRAAQERAIAEVEAEMARLCELLAEGLAMGVDEGREMVGGAMSEFLVEFFDLARAEGSRPGVKAMITLPLLVHGAETGEPGPAMPVAVLHLLWWASARYLCDLTGAAGAPSPGGARRRGRVLTALAVGGQLPGRSSPACPPARPSAPRSRTSCRAPGWTPSTAGSATSPSGRRTRPPSRYCAATRAGPRALRDGRGLGRAPRRSRRPPGRGLAGVRPRPRRAAPLADDQRDLASGRYEDLAAGTATFLLVHLLAELPPARRREALALHASARHSASARAEMASWMLDEEVAESYAASLAPLIDRAHGLLDMLGGDPGCVRELHRVVDGTVGHLPGLPLAAA
ncbi:hypothetical protein ACFQY7_02515 [Actinomadura luteofluorescens]|uniref:hypothetical protein n=1 Tax=Actinomadura luteofluorescens TaxID=46163 RepID=UPI003630CE03